MSVYLITASQTLLKYYTDLKPFWLQVTEAKSTVASSCVTLTDPKLCQQTHCLLFICRSEASEEGEGEEVEVRQRKPGQPPIRLCVHLLVRSAFFLSCNL